MTELRDNRPHLELDAKKMQMWEIEAIETTTTNGLLVLCRYLCNGSGPISPNLPYKPIDELNRAELSQIKNSKAYKTLRRFEAGALEAAIGKIRDGAGF